MGAGASSLSVDPEWLGLTIVIIPILFAGMAFYIKSVVNSAVTKLENKMHMDTLTIREKNGGAHLADVPDRLERLEERHHRAERESKAHSKQLHELIRRQKRIMERMGGFDEDE